MKTKQTTVKLEKIENNFAYIDLHFSNLTVNRTFKLVVTPHIVRLNSSHLVSELKIFMDWIKTEDNESEIILFAKEIFKANDILNKSKLL